MSSLLQRAGRGKGQGEVMPTLDMTLFDWTDYEDMKPVDTWPSSRKKGEGRAERYQWGPVNTKPSDRCFWNWLFWPLVTGIWNLVTQSSRQELDRHFCYVHYNAWGGFDGFIGQLWSRCWCGWGISLLPDVHKYLYLCERPLNVCITEW